jgi:hypothetical protein
MLKPLFNPDDFCIPPGVIRAAVAGESPLLRSTVTTAAVMSRGCSRLCVTNGGSEEVVAR